MRPFMPHQQQAFDWASDRKAVALFMEMRLGKTATAIRWARAQMDGLAHMNGAVRYLVVAPLTTLAGWRRELVEEEGVLDSTVVRLDGLSAYDRDAIAARVPQVTGHPTWFLINYEALRAWKRAALVQWDVVILDESTRIKNAKAQITKILTQNFSDAPYRAILTGLPNPEGLLDYYPQMQFVNGGSFMGFRNFWAWREALFFESGYDWIPRRAKPGVPSTREKIKAAVSELAFIMSRKEAKVGSVLLNEVRTVPMNAVQRRMWRDVKKHFKIGSTETKSAGAQFVWLQRIAGGFSPDRSNPQLIASAKYDEIRRLLDGELKGQQLVIWFNFNEELAYVFHTLRLAGFRVAAMLGTTSVTKRELRQRKFQRGEVQIFCVQEALGKFGLDLSVADTEIYYSNSYSYETRSQSQDRIVHPKKTTPLLAIDLVTEDTTDEDVVDVLRDKKTDARSFNSKLLQKIRQRMEPDA